MIYSKALGGALNEASPRRDSAGCFTSPPTSLLMRVSPRAFSLEKAMIIKGSQAIDVGFTEDGLICLEQYSTEFGKPVSIFINLNQFRNIEKYVGVHYLDILAAWNDGVE